MQGVQKLSPDMRALVKKWKMKLLFNKKTAAFYAPFAYLPVNENPEFPTYYTDGRQIVVSPEFTKHIDNDEKSMGVFFHEIVHNVLGHTAKDFPKVTHQKVMQKAQEIAVNNIVLEAGLELPPTDYIDQNYIGQSTLAIYYDLVEKGETDENTNGGESWECIQIDESTDKNDPSQSQQGQSQDEGKGLAQGSGNSDDDKEGQNSGVGKLPERLTQSTVSIKLGEVQRLLSEAGSSTLTRTIGELIEEVTIPVIDWADKLTDSLRRNFDGVTLDLANPVKQYMDIGIYIPKYKDDSIEDLYVALDVSCSLNQEELSKAQKVINEIKDIYAIENTVIITYNHAIVDRTDYSEYEPVDITKLRGGGGTQGDAVFAYLKERQETPYALLVISDTEDTICTPAEEVPYNVIWLNTSEHEAFPYGSKPEFGEIISI